MAFWTPYAQDAPLDLSIKDVKSENISPCPASSAPELPPLMQDYYATYMNGYHYQPAMPYTVPAMPYAVPAMPYAVPATSYVAPAISHVAPEMSHVAPATISRNSNESWSHTQPKPPSSITSDLHDFDTESLSEDMEYQVYERDAMQGLAEKNGGSLLGNNPRMRRAVQASQAADDAYRQQRERNNFAAKQSRDRRKLREVRLAFQVSYLKKKMALLKAQLAAGVCGRCGRI